MSPPPARDFRRRCARPGFPEFDRHPGGHGFDWIDDGEGLLAWLEQARLVPAEALEALRAQAMPGELDNVAAQARSLREWFRSFVRQRKGRPLHQRPWASWSRLNRLLERDERFGRIVAQPESGSVRSGVRDDAPVADPEALLLPIGEALAKFVCDGDFSNVKACEGPALHADVRRPHARPCAHDGAAWRSAATARNRPLIVTARSRIAWRWKLQVFELGTR